MNLKLVNYILTKNHTKFNLSIIYLSYLFLVYNYFAIIIQNYYKSYDNYYFTFFTYLLHLINPLKQ